MKYIELRVKPKIQDEETLKMLGEDIKDYLYTWDFPDIEDVTYEIKEVNITEVKHE